VYHLTEFSKNLRKLREDKKISQKSVAASLGVSQALLSHYEKGIRECGLDFLARAAKFYDVTTDFLLGLSEEREVEQNRQSEVTQDIKKDGNTYSIAMLYRNLIIHATAHIFGALNENANREAAVLSGKYMTLAIYRLCGILYSGLDVPPLLAEQHMMAELAHITEISEMDAPLGEYAFDNVYLNNIIKTVEL